MILGWPVFGFGICQKEQRRLRMHHHESDAALGIRGLDGFGLRHTVK